VAPAAPLDLTGRQRVGAGPAPAPTRELQFATTTTTDPGPAHRTHHPSSAHPIENPGGRSIKTSRSPRRLAAAAAAALLAGVLVATPASAADPQFPDLTPEALVAHDFTLYFANAGASVVDSVATGDHMGLYQTVTDQQFGVDAATGANWGYVLDDTSNPVANDSSGNDKLASLRYDEEPVGADLTTRRVGYAFDLPDGTYQVTFGFSVPTSWGGRQVLAQADGQTLEAFNTGTGPMEKTYTVPVADGTLDLAVASPSSRTSQYADPMVSYFIVRAVPEWTAAVLQAQVAQATLTEDQAAGYAPDSVAELQAALDAAQGLVDAGSTGPAAMEAAYRQIASAWAGLRPIITYDSFRPGQPWLDTNGNAIQAHGGQVVAATDESGQRIWYWYGEDRSNGYYDSPGVHVYSSRDLYNWTDEGLALRAMSSQDQFQTEEYFADLYAGYTDAQREVVWRDLSTNQVRTDGWSAPSILERPKVIYNESTGQWVMWVHSDGPESPTSTSTYARAEAGVAVSDSPTGPFRWIDSYRLDRVPSDSVPWCGTASAFDPAGGMARDMNLFVDEDGTGYIVYSSEENRTIYISRLDADYTYLSVPPESAVQGEDFARILACSQREAPALFTSGGRYYLITSGATGWDANPARYATATDILGEWTDHGNPMTGDAAANTYSSQGTSVIGYDAQAGKFIFMADRWTPNDLANAPYVWLPITFGEGGTVSITPTEEWSLGDLPAYRPWTVDTPMPEHVWLGDVTALPTEVSVTTAGQTEQVPVAWDPTSVAQPGPALARGTLADGRTFTRSVLVVPHDLRYVVNAGGVATNDWQQIMAIAGAESQVLNDVPEQPLSTGATWGYTGSSGTAGDASGDIYTTLRYATNKASLVYTFTDLAPGTYTVYAGYYDPWPWANRAAAVSVNGQTVDAQRLFTGAYTSGAYEGIVVGQDGTITVTVAPTRAPDIQLSWLMVARPRTDQTITFDPIATHTLGDPPLQLGATTTSGLPVSYQASGACTVDGTVLTPTSAGTCSVTASQAGNEDVRPAAPLTQVFTVRTPVLDNFNRRPGPVGGAWGGRDSLLSYYLFRNALHPLLGGDLIHPTVYGPTQEAFVRLASVDRRSTAQGVLLKVQSANTVVRGGIAVVYDARTQSVRVSTVGAARTGWRAYPAARAPFRDGDVLTGRAHADGTVEVFRNDELVATVHLTDADAAALAGSGRIGIWTAGAPGAVLDDFGGGPLLG